MNFPFLDRWNDGPQGAATPFATLARREAPGFDELLLALAAEFRPVDRRGALDRLDDLGRRLFGVQPLAPAQAARRVAAVLGDEVGLRARHRGLGCLFLDETLRKGTGHPLLLAVAYLEAGRRAGLRVALLSAGPVWLVGVGLDQDLSVIDPAPGPGSGLDGEAELHRHCPHEAAYAVLGGLSASFRGRGNEAAASTAETLQSLLAIEHREHGDL